MLKFKLDSDGDGQLSLEEFKVLFENAEKRRKETHNKTEQVKVILIQSAYITNSLFLRISCRKN